MIYKNLIHKLEMTCRELLGAEMTPTDIHSLVNMILNDWIIDGQPTQEYLELAARAVELRQQSAEPATNIVGVNGERISTR
jgi:hypothetical protein